MRTVITTKSIVLNSKSVKYNNIHQEQQQQQQDNHQRVIIQDGWIDVCKELLCINLTVEEKLFRVTYKDIYGLNFCADLNRVEVSS
jgi:hypothetical protein